MKVVSKKPIDFARRSAPGNNSAKVFKTVTQDVSDERGSFKQSLVARALTNDTSLARVSFPADIIASQRAETLRRFKKLKKKCGASKAARIVGASVPTLWRWQKMFSAHGQPGLRPNNFKSGRRSPFKKIRLSVEGVRKLELLIAELSSPRAAWQRFAADPLCAPSLARYVQRNGHPPAPLARLGHVSPVPARVFISDDGCRVFVKLPCKNRKPIFKMARINLP